MKTSIHLEKYPRASEIPHNGKLLSVFRVVKEICNTALSLRNLSGIKVRIPISEMEIHTNENLGLEDYTGIIMDEINVKNIKISQNLNKVAKEKVTLNLKVCGAKFGSNTGKIMQMVNSGQFTKISEDSINVGEFTLEKEDFNLEFSPIEANSGYSFFKVSFGKFSSINPQILISINTNITEDLKIEGIARDIVRHIQQDRKASNFFISDIVKMKIQTTSKPIIEALSNLELCNYITKQTLSHSSFFEVLSSPEPNATIFEHEIESSGQFSVLFFGKK